MAIAPAPRFHSWDNYFGELVRVFDYDGRSESVVYGWENLSAVRGRELDVVLGAEGAVFGFVETGEVEVRELNRGPGLEVRYDRVAYGEWFTAADGCRIVADGLYRVFAVQRRRWRGLRTKGGPIEWAGRLKYIDGCSDSLLVAPPVKGDPCLNLLHFPPLTAQTFHHHPSVRAGIGAKGKGWCHWMDGEDSKAVPLDGGTIWVIEARCVHRFSTTSESRLDVIAYHPDSDHGPEHESHPMINRTWEPGTDRAMSSVEAREIVDPTAGF